MSWPSRGLYAITAAQTVVSTEILLTAVTHALAAGVRLVQYRNKTATNQQKLVQIQQLRKLCDKYHALLIINDDIELADLGRADGVHLGKQDPAIAVARAQLGEQAIIGISCYNDLAYAQQMQQAGASYVAFGSVYASPSKPQAVRTALATLTAAKACLAIPVCAIGGINANNIQAVAATGVDLFAIISGIFDQPDIPQAVCELQRQITCGAHGEQNG